MNIVLSTALNWGFKYIIPLKTLRKKAVNDISVNVAGVILAAGTSSRVGQTKQLLPLNGKAILTHVIEAAIDSLLNRVILVLGHAAREIQQMLNYPEISIVYNPMYEKGQSYSIKYGLREVDRSADAVLFLLGDQPLVQPETINKLITAYAKKRSLIVLPTFQGRRGNPVLFDRRLFQRLKNLSGDSGGKELLEEYADQMSPVAVQDPGIHFDVDTHADYLELQKRAPGK